MLSYATLTLGSANLITVTLPNTYQKTILLDSTLSLQKDLRCVVSLVMTGWFDWDLMHDLRDNV